MALIEHEVPEHDLVHLLELRKENLEIVEVQIDEDAPAAGKRVEQLDLPEGSRLISVMRNGRSEIAVGATELRPGDQVLAILQPGKEDELRRVLLKSVMRGRRGLARALAAAALPGAAVRRRAARPSAAHAPVRVAASTRRST